MYLTKEQLEHLDAMRTRAYSAMERHRKEVENNTTPIDRIFENSPPGDFKWEQEEAGDWHVYQCDEKDCPVGWHKIAYATNISRKNDKKEIELMSVDFEGEWDSIHVWESGEDQTDICMTMDLQINDYFFGWFKYWEYCARTGTDVLEEADHPSIENFIKFAEEDLKYLEMSFTKKEE